MKLSDSQIGHLVREVIRAGKINFNDVLSAIQAIQPVVDKVKQADKLQLSEPTTTDYTFKVNYNQSLETMIKAGKYNWVNSDITKEHFPIENTGEKEVETELFHFNRKISTEDAIAEMDQAGFRPAKPAELLKFGELYPNLQREFPILALGQFWTDPRDRRSVLGLNCDGGKRKLNLSWYDRDWNDNCRFLGVHK